MQRSRGRENEGIRKQYRVSFGVALASRRQVAARPQNLGASVSLVQECNGACNFDISIGSEIPGRISETRAQAELGRGILGVLSPRASPRRLAPEFPPQSGTPQTAQTHASSPKP